MRRLLALTLAAPLALSCSAGPSLGLAQGCQPLLAGADCLLPYPSDFFLDRSGAAPAVSVTGAARVLTKTGLAADLAAGRPQDGFSPNSTLVALLGAVSAEGFVRLEDGGGPSLELSSSSLLVEAGSHALVPHFVDLDPRAAEPSRQAIVLHPFAPLKPGTRYVVLLHQVKGPDGAPVAAPEGFRRLREKQASGDVALEALSKDYEATVFPAAAAVGVPRASLQLAWAFTTGSDDWASRDLLRVRELTLEWLAANTSRVTVTQAVDAPAGKVDVWRIVRGTVTGPLFLTTPQPFAKLHRGADGQVAQNGTVDFSFVAVVPTAVRDAAGPSPVFLYGHGFFGSTAEAEDRGATDIAQASRRTLLATDWWGMHLSDVGKVVDALQSNPSHGLDFVDRVHQAMANWLVLSAAVPGLGGDAAFQRAGGAPFVTGTADAFLGISQGHILGGTLGAIHPTASKVALQVGGAGLTGLMMRARPFAQFLDFLSTSVPDPLDQQKLIATMQRPFDRVDPATYARHYFAAPLPGNAEKHVLMQVGLMDPAVPNVGSWYHARALGLGVLQPTPATPWGLEAAPAAPGAALTIFDFQLGDPAAFYRTADFAPSDNAVHGGVRLLGAAQRQLDAFFRTGVVEATCAGPCDPE